MERWLHQALNSARSHSGNGDMSASISSWGSWLMKTWFPALQEFIASFHEDTNSTERGNKMVRKHRGGAQGRNTLTKNLEMRWREREYCKRAALTRESTVHHMHKGEQCPRGRDDAVTQQARLQVLGPCWGDLLQASRCPEQQSNMVRDFCLETAGIEENARHRNQNRRETHSPCKVMAV